MPAELKPGVYTIVHTVKFACRFITKHGGTIHTVLATVLTSSQLATYDAFAAATVALCDVFNIVYPDIKP